MTISEKHNFSDTFAPTVADYVQNGLVCLYDGENNCGINIHSNDTLTWKNLGSWGSDYDATRKTGSFGSNCATFNRDGYVHSIFLIGNYLLRSLNSAWTVETVFMANQKYAQNYSGIFGNHHDYGNAIVFGQYENGTVGFSTYQPSRALVKIPSSEIVGRKIAYSMTADSNIVHYMNGDVYSRFLNLDTRLTFDSSPFTAIGSAWFHSEFGETSDRGFDGCIFCVRVYNRALTELEVQSNFAIDNARFCIK